MPATVAMENEPLVIAVPKGRILDEAMPLIRGAGIEPEAAFEDPDSRLLRFKTNHPHVELIRVRAFDVASFVAFGAAQLGIAGSDVIMEFDFSELYAPLDLKIGRCRLSVAEPTDLVSRDDPTRWSYVRVATKYPEVTKRHFAARGVHQAERRDGTGADPGHVPAHRRSGVDRADPEGKRVGRDREDRRCHLASDRQSYGPEDPAYPGRRMDRGGAGRGRGAGPCRVGSPPGRPPSRPISMPS